MRKFSILLIAAVAVFTGTGCLKNETCSPKSVSSEAPAIQAYAQTNGIAAVPHTSGLYYEILDPGSGDAPDDNSTIYIRYTGKLLDGTVFDQKTNAAETGWILGGLIEGWRIGLPLIQEGGHIRLIVPSAMAYGCMPYGGLPGNSILFFDIELVDVQ